jgi:hypothetical protein
VCKSVPQQKC